MIRITEDKVEFVEESKSRHDETAAFLSKKQAEIAAKEKIREEAVLLVQWSAVMINAKASTVIATWQVQK